MSSVDERIVEMRFDNQQFESGASTSMKTLDKLKNSLNGLGDSASNLTNLQTSADNLDISGIANGVDRISDRFSVLGIVADQVIRTVTNGLMGIGIQAANAIKGLTISPIASGFSKYEQETKSIQTLVNATGLEMDAIEKYTEKLGFYVDETSYSYESMISTLSSMMSSGVDNIDTAVDALIGLGNAAGLAGVDASQSAHAFEGFGKAIAQGYMDSRTWSWIKTGGMGTIALKDAFINAAIEAGTLVQEIDKEGNAVTYVANKAGKANKQLGEVTAKNLENFFGEKVLNRDVLLAGVEKYSKAFEQIYNEYLETGDTAEEIIKRLGLELDEYSLKAFKAANQTRTFSDVVEYISGSAARRWSKAFKKIFGNAEESAELWASIIDPMYDLFITPLDSMNDLLDNWRELGGYEHIVEGIQNTFKGLINTVTVFKNVFHDIFPAVTAERFFKMTESLKTFSERFKQFSFYYEAENGKFYTSNIVFNNLIKSFKGGLSVISLIGKAFKTLFGSLSPTSELLKKFGDRALRSFGNLGQVLTNINNSEKTLEFFNKISEKLVNVQTKLIGVVDKVNAKFAIFISTIKKDAIDGFKGIVAGASLAWKGIKAFGEVLKPIGDLLKTISSSLGDFLFSLGVDFASIFGSIGRFLTELNKCNDGTEMLGKIQEKVSDITSEITEKFVGLKDAIKGVYNNIKEFAKGNIKDTFKNIFKNFDISTLTSMLAGLGGALAGVNLYRLFDLLRYRFAGFWSDLEEAVTKGIDTLGTIEDAFYSFGKNISAGVIMKIAIAIGLLAGALLLLGSVKPEALAQGLLGITILLAELYAIMKLFTKNDIFSAFKDGQGSIMRASTSMLVMAAAVLLLASSVKMLSKLDTESMMSGLIAIIALMATLTKMSIIISKKAGDMAIGAAGMIGMAAAVLILSAAVKSLSSIDSGFGQGLLGTVALMVMMTAAAIAMSKWGGKLTGTAIGMIGMAAAMVIMAQATKQFASMDANSLGNSIFAIGALLAVLTAFNALSGSSGKMLASGASLLAISAAFVVMSVALKSISAIDPSSLGNSIFGITALLTIIAAFNQLGGSALNMIGMAAGLLVMSAAITILVPALTAMGAASGMVVDGILMLAGVFIVLGAAALLLGPIVPSLLALAAALLVISVAVAVAGAGLLLLSAGMTAFGAALTASIAEIIAAVDTLILGLASIAASLVGAVAIIIGAIAMGFASAVPTVVAAILILIVGILNALAQYAPQIAAAGAQLIIGLLNTIATYAGPLAEAGLNLIISLINGMANAVSEHGDELLNAFGNLMAAIIGFVGEALARLVELIPGIGPKMASGMRGLIGLIKGELTGADLGETGAEVAGNMVEGAESISGDAESAGQTLGDSLVSGVESTEGDALTAGTESGTSVVDGFSTMLGEANIAGIDLGNSGVDGILSTIPQFESAGSNGGAGLVQGLLSQLGAAKSAGASLGSAAASGAAGALNEHSPSKVFEKIGVFAAEGFCIGVSDMLSKVVNSTENLGNIASESAISSLNAISEFIDSANAEYHPVITPVFDLSAIKDGKNAINGYLNSTLPLGIKSNIMPNSNEVSQISELIAIGRAIITEIQNGSDLYFDDGAFAGRINRRLGVKI